jgi:RNA 3'-terminal phosphate cyclase (ATP)
MIEIDGSQGEGGGQILRTALALSLISGKAFTLNNIRAKRPKPGLMRQHLACVRAAQAIAGGAQHCHAVNAAGQVSSLGDTSLVFTPAPVAAGQYEFAVDSAGSCALVFQTVLWPLILAKEPSHLVLRGGTHNPLAPSFTFLTLMAKYFAGNLTPFFSIDLKRHGFYPAGGGEAHVTVLPPDALHPVQLTQRGVLQDAYAIALHAGLAKSIAQRELAVLKTALGWKDDKLHDRALRANEGPGNALIAVLQYEHITQVCSAYGERGVSAEEIAKTLVKEIRAYQQSSAPVGPHMADQLMIPAALVAAGMGGDSASSEYWATELTEHTKTNAQIIEAFLPVRFELEAAAVGFNLHKVRVLDKTRF